MASKTSLLTIRKFLSCKRIALVGLSRDPKHFSRAVFNELLNRGYDVVPVNPHSGEIDSHVCFPTAAGIKPPVEAALIMTPPAQSEDAVRDCLAAGVNRIWLHRGAGQGSVTPAAVKLCHQHHVELVEGECPFMYLPDTQWFHSMHGMIRKLTGSYAAT